ncbi:tetratricopeptide repeat protein [Oleiagrimonas sp. C23AA]|uniref:tetratricopeptide repeat protein n=1 Tax=Oleiagrimonas sp. C23AA TaxID=2719047 RepID=UPI00142386BF|nr:tetratricopeptide repeat protein [Oleiagrimonas sp. C23AA]NII10565.1 hypothetical protein [Oleiagrimonas sp. C23AA]
MQRFRSLLALVVGGLLAAPALAAPAPSMPDLLTIQHQWAHISYELPKKSQGAAFASLEQQAAALVSRQPHQAPPLIWQAIVLSSDAGATGGLGALSKVKHAKKLLEQAKRINPKALDGSIYTTLGSLYYQVPGWPIGFGSNDKARQSLKKALEIDPNGIDPNYFYGDFLFRQGHPQQALIYLHRALNAPARPQRLLADKGRREQIRQLIAKIGQSH